MRHSVDKILTTHTGSLPRPPELRALLVKKDQGEPYDKAELARLTREAVIAIVKASEKPDVILRITAAKDAKLGDYKIYLKGTPETGEATSTEITVKVVSP